MGATTLVISESSDKREQSGWAMIISLVLDGIASPHTHRAYAQALEEFVIWFQSERHHEFNKATVQKYRRELV